MAKMARASEAEKKAYWAKRERAKANQLRPRSLTAWVGYHPAFQLLVRNVRIPGFPR